MLTLNLGLQVCYKMYSQFDTESEMLQICCSRLVILVLIILDWLQFETKKIYFYSCRYVRLILLSAPLCQNTGMSKGPVRYHLQSEITMDRLEVYNCKCSMVIITIYWLSDEHFADFYEIPRQSMQWNIFWLCYCPLSTNCSSL